MKQRSPSRLSSANMRPLLVMDWAFQGSEDAGAVVDVNRVRRQLFVVTWTVFEGVEVKLRTGGDAI